MNRITAYQGSGVIESLQIERQQAEKAYQAGETPLYTMLDTSRRLVTARRARLDARVDLLNAAIALDRAIGRSCAVRPRRGWPARRGCR